MEEVAVLMVRAAGLVNGHGWTRK